MTNEQIFEAFNQLKEKIYNDIDNIFKTNECFLNGFFKGEEIRRKENFKIISFVNDK